VSIEKQGVSTVLKTGNNEQINRLQKVDPGIQNILNTLPFNVLLINSGHLIIAVNEALTRGLGMNEDQLLGAHCSTVIHELSAPVKDCPLEEAIQKGTPVERELFDNKNKRWLNASIYPTPIVTVEGKPIFLHFIRDITDYKNATIELSRSLEHHKALCDLLQNLQYCQNCAQILDTLIAQVLSLSWLGMAATAVGFLFNGKDLELITHHNVAPELLEKCRRLAPGECLCGKAAETGRSIVGPSGSPDHSIKYEGMVAHQHAVLPIRHKGSTLGVLTLYLNPGDEIDDFRLGFLEAATAAAGAALDGQLAREQILRTQEKCLAQVISSQEDERKRVAGDLHDQLCQSLSAILMEIQSNGSRNTTNGTVQCGIETRIRDLIDQVRRMAGQLRPAILDDFGLESALARKIEDISLSKEISIDFTCVPSDQKKNRLPAEVEVGLYRVAVEALENSVLHASAAHVSVVLLWQPNKVILLIEDDGCGFDLYAVRKDMDRCMGLIGMEERMTVLGGKLQIESAPQKGTTVRAEMPVKTIPHQT
jgi:PAS domain S-box-containing protein